MKRLIYAWLVATGAVSMFWSIIEGELTRGHKESVATAGIIAVAAVAMRMIEEHSTRKAVRP